MIREQRAVEEMLPVDAYMQGFQDCANGIEDAAEQEPARNASRAARQLDALVDRIWLIAPWNDVPDPPEAELWPGETRVFDGEQE